MQTCLAVSILFDNGKSKFGTTSAEATIANKLSQK